MFNIRYIHIRAISFSNVDSNFGDYCSFSLSRFGCVHFGPTVDSQHVRRDWLSMFNTSCGTCILSNSKYIILGQLYYEISSYNLGFVKDLFCWHSELNGRIVLFFKYRIAAGISCYLISWISWCKSGSSARLKYINWLIFVFGGRVGRDAALSGKWEVLDLVLTGELSNWTCTPNEPVS